MGTIRLTLWKKTIHLKRMKKPTRMDRLFNIVILRSMKYKELLTGISSSLGLTTIWVKSITIMLTMLGHSRLLKIGPISLLLMIAVIMEKIKMVISKVLLVSRNNITSWSSSRIWLNRWSKLIWMYIRTRTNQFHILIINKTY